MTTSQIDLSGYSIKERIFLVETYYRTRYNFTQIAEEWSREFPNKPSPDQSIIKGVVEKFSNTGRVFDVVKDKSDKPRSSRTPEIIEEARKIIEEEPTISSRCLSQRLNVSQAMALNLLEEDLKCFINNS